MASRTTTMAPWILAACLGALAANAVPAQEPERDLGWSDQAELSYVLVGGNAQATSLGFKNTLMRTWERGRFTLRTDGIRAKTTTETLTATGTPDDFDIVRDESTDTTAEYYLVHGRYDRDISARFFWYAGAGWERNRFAGFDDRTAVQAGLGNVWHDTEDLKFRTDYAVTWTDQQDVVEVPGADTSFLGARLSYAYLNKLGASTTFTSLLIVDENLEETSDLRGDFTNAVAVKMTERLALKASLQLLYDHQPAVEAVALTPGPGEVFLELDDLDTIFTTALVVSF